MLPEGDSAPPPAAQPGADCDASKIMTHDAALCVARAQGFAEGIGGLQAGLFYDTHFRRIVWNVQNTLSSQPGRAQGEAIKIDAITGEVLERTGWSAMA